MMPKVDRSLLNSGLIDLFKKTNNRHKECEYSRIVETVVKNTDEIRSSKPSFKKLTEPELTIARKSAYVWRMVVFSVSKKRQHQCMPVCADFDLPARDSTGKWSSSTAREMSKELDQVVDVIVNAVPKSQWHGIARWGRALGY